MAAPRTYRLELQGLASDVTTRLFAPMSVSYDDGNTVLEGPVRDQAELHGLLQRCLALGLTLVSVTSTPNGGPPT